MTREAQDAQAMLSARDANRKACPIAASLFDALIAAQTANEGDQGIVASFIIQVGGRIDDREEVSAEDAEKALRQCGLWPEALVTDKIEVGDFGTMRAVCFGGVWRWVSDFGPTGTLPATHAVIINGVEVARIPAKNDWHAINKAKKLFGMDARAVKLLDEPAAVSDPFARIR